MFNIVTTSTEVGGSLPYDAGRCNQKALFESAASQFGETGGCCSVLPSPFK